MSYPISAPSPDVHGCLLYSSDAASNNRPAAIAVPVPSAFAVRCAARPHLTMSAQAAQPDPLQRPVKSGTALLFPDRRGAMHQDVQTECRVDARLRAANGYRARCSAAIWAA